MQIRVGYELIYECPNPTPMIVMLSVHYTRASDLVRPDYMIADPAVPITSYRDSFGNWCSRIVAPPGRLRLTADAVIRDSGAPDPLVPDAVQHPVEALPEECLVYLLGSRYCEVDRLSDTAWRLFGQAPTGWGRVQAICDFVHNHLTFGYEQGRSKTASEAFAEGTGVCRDFTHLAISFCRAMNIPARYCTGYLSDIGEKPPYGTMDFAAWLEAYVGGAWHVFDPRNNARRIGRILIARGRDAADVAITTTFGPNTLAGFTVWTDEIVAPAGTSTV